MKLKVQIILLITICSLVACTHTQTCKDKTFKNYTWKSGAFENMRFGDDDTIRYDVPILNVTGAKTHYNFYENCNGYTFYFAGSNPMEYEITSVSENTITAIYNGGSTVTFTKQ